MSQKRKRIETSAVSAAPAAPIYAIEVEWLRGLTIMDRSSHDTVNTSADAARLILEACKLTYMLYHDIEAHDCLGLLLESLYKDAKSSSINELIRQAKQQQSSWKGYTLNKFLLPHVREMKRKWEIAHPYAGFASLSDEERTRTWMESYDADPKSVISQMLKPIIMVLDLEKVFGGGVVSEDATKMRAVWEMLRKKYWFGCHYTYEYSVAVERKAQTSKEWAKYRECQLIMPNIVPIVDVPVSRTFATMDFSSKKVKMPVAEATIQRQLEGAPEKTPSQPLKQSNLPLIAGGGHKDQNKSCRILDHETSSGDLEMYGNNPKRSNLDTTTHSPCVLEAEASSSTMDELTIRSKVWVDDASYFTPPVSSTVDALSVQTSKVDDDVL